MALSNIFREPRREITESVVGVTVSVLVVTGLLAIAWPIASAWVASDPIAPFAGALIAVLLGELIAAFGVFLLALLTHAIGEHVCNALARNGVELRPRRR